MKRVSFLLASVNLIFAIFQAVILRHYYTYANICIAIMILAVIRFSKKPDRHLLNFIWNGIFIPYNIAALVIFHTEGRNIFMAKHSFFIQYVLFVVAAYIGKLIYSKYSDSRGEKENGRQRIAKNIFRHMVIFAALYICSAVTLKIFTLCGLLYENRSNITFNIAFLSFLVLILINYLVKRKRINKG